MMKVGDRFDTALQLLNDLKFGKFKSFNEDDGLSFEEQQRQRALEI